MSKRSAPPEVKVTIVSLEKTVLITKWVRKEDGMLRYFVGDEIKIVYNIAKDDIYIDPTVASVNVLDPSGVKTEFLVADAELTNIDTGKWEFVYTLLLAGEYIIAWKGDAPAIGIAESRVYTRASKAL